MAANGSPRLKYYSAAAVSFERILLFEQKCVTSFSRVFSVGHVYTSKMQTMQRYKKLSTELMQIVEKLKKYT